MHRGAASQWKEGEDFGCGGLEDIRKNPLYTHVFSKAAESPDSGVKFKCNEIEKNKTNEKIFDKVYFNALCHGLREKFVDVLKVSEKYLLIESI